MIINNFIGLSCGILFVYDRQDKEIYDNAVTCFEKEMFLLKCQVMSCRTYT